MANTGHVWNVEELHDLRTLDYDAFRQKHAFISKDAYRHKKRSLTTDVEAAEPPVLQVAASAPGMFVGFETVYWDLETTSLTAIMGRLLCASFCDPWGNVTTFRIEDFPGKNAIDDSRLALAVRDYLDNCDHWVTWNGKLFDVPFLNARLLKAGQRGLRSDILHTDLMYYAGGQFVRIGSRKLDNVSKFVDSPNRKTELEWETWQLAGTGDSEAMKEVVEHNVADVLVTRDVFAHLKEYVRNVHR